MVFIFMKLFDILEVLYAEDGFCFFRPIQWMLFT